MTTTGVEQLYREQVLRHSRDPHHRRAVADATHIVEGNNPLCGDKITVFVTLGGAHVVDVSFEGTGCAISMAAASMMSEMLSGIPQDSAHSVIGDVLKMMQMEPREPTPDPLRDTPVAALSSVRQYPSRVKCATLAWQAASRAVNDNTDTTITTE